MNRGTWRVGIVVCLAIVGVGLTAAVGSASTAEETVSDTAIEEIEEDVEAENSRFTARVDMSLFTSFFAEGSSFRLTVGGSAFGERVVWFDIAVLRTDSGFDTHSEMWMNAPGM